ncbi:AAA family ATPase [Angustibacter luteus]|uniref:AAA family ATPase n=1 Tax=Angustibacter luteus TaxID=658456 RepID=A0ABW1JDK1_9ACTN
MPPLLLVLNGPPAVGKSTLARRYVADHPTCLNLDVDVLRGSLGGWQKDPHASGLWARALALSMARVHLLGGDSVVVPQLIARPQFLDALTDLATETGAQLVEVVLVDDRGRLATRFAERTARAERPEHVDAGWLAAAGSDRLGPTLERLEALVAQRSCVAQVAITPDDVEATYRCLLEAIADHAR